MAGAPKPPAIPAWARYGLMAVTLVGCLGLGAFFQSRLGGAGPSAGVETEVAGSRLLATATTTSTTTTTTSTTTTTEAPPAPRTATLAFTGDTLAHRGVVRQAAAYGQETEREYDFAPMFELVEPYLADADIAICHLETPLSADNRGLSGYPTFNVPGDLADGLVAAGYDGCSTASNHSLDRRTEGVFETLDVLDEAGLGHVGMARSISERNAPPVYDAAGIKVANLSYSYGFNGFSVPAETPWLANVIDVDVIAADAVSARSAGAEYVVVSLHWGTEYRHDPDAQQLAVAEALAGVPEIDLLIGHHAHVVQPIDRLGDTYVVYGMGNFLSNQSAICCVVGAQDGVIVRAHLTETDTGFDTDLSFVPTWVDRDDFTIVPVLDGLAAAEADSTAARALVASRERTTSVITELGISRSGVSESLPISSDKASD